MAKPTVGKPPQGLAGEQLANWYADAYAEAYEKTLFDHREDRRKAQAEAEAAKAELAELEKKVPADGDVLLTGDDAKRWAELGKIDLDDLRAKAEAGDRLTRHAFLREAAEATGFKPSTFTELVEQRGVKIEKIEEDGKPPSYAVAIDKDGKTQHVDVVDHFQATFADWLPALTPSEAPAGFNAPPPNLGRLPSAPPRRPANDQQAWLDQRAEEAKRSQNVLAQRFTGGKT